MRIQRKNFTLIEILVVMLIMGTLLLIMLPAFSRMMTGNKVDQAASSLKLALERAHSHAVTTRKNVAVILPNDSSIWTGTTESRYFNGGYRLAYVEATGNANTWRFVNWLADSDWVLPVEGAYLRGITNTNGSFPAAGTGLGSSLLSTSASDAFARIPADILATITNYENNNTTSRANCAVIFSPYGNVRGGNDFYFIIVECVITGTNFAYRNTDSGGLPTNFLILNLNRFTGRTTYHTP